MRKKKYVRNFTEYRKDLEVKIKVFLEKLSEQGDDAKESAYILQKYMSGGNITKEEESKVKECFFDILKMAGIGIPFILIPGASLLIPAIIHVAKKYKINFKIGMLLSILFGALGAILGALVFKWIKPYIKK